MLWNDTFYCTLAMLYCTDIRIRISEGRRSELIIFINI